MNGEFVSGKRLPLILQCVCLIYSNAVCRVILLCCEALKILLASLAPTNGLGILRDHLQSLRFLGKMDPKEVDEPIGLRATFLSAIAARALEKIYLLCRLRMPRLNVKIQRLLVKKLLGAMLASVRKSSFVLLQMIMHRVLLFRCLCTMRADEVTIRILLLLDRHRGFSLGLGAPPRVQFLRLAARGGCLGSFLSLYSRWILRESVY